MDIDINFEGEIGTYLLPEKVEIGLIYDDKKDWSNDWKKKWGGKNMSDKKTFSETYYTKEN